MRGAKTELEEAGLETENMAETTAVLQKKLLGLTGGKVDIMLDANTFKNTTEILREMSGAWEDMTDIQQAAALELMGGKRQANILSSIIQNFDTVEGVIETSANSSNSALEENAKWMDSIEGKTKQFTNAVNTMWNDTLDSGFLKFIIDVGTTLIKVADGVEIFGHKIGNMWTTVALLGATVIKTINKLSWGEFFTSIGTSITGLNVKLEGLLTRLGILKTTSQATQVASQGVTVGMLQEKLAIAGVSEENQKLILSKVGLDAANKSQVISSDLTTMATLREAVANKSLSEAEAFSIARKLGLITVTKGLNGATTLRIAKLVGLTNAETISLGKTLGVIGATKKLTKEEIKNAIAKAGITDATKAATLQNLLYLASQGNLIASFKLLRMQINNFLTKNKLLLGIAAAALAIYGIVKLFDKWITTLEESEEILTDLNSALESTEDKLKDLESELKEVRDRIKELNEQESLTFVEQEELDKLREQNDELERQINLTSKTREAQQKEVNNQALKTAQQYEEANFKSGKGKEDYKQTGATAGSIIGGVAGGIAAGIGTTALAAKVGGTIGTFIGGPIGTAIGVALGAAVGAVIVGVVGSEVGGVVADAQTQIGESMDNMLEQRKKLQEEYNKAHAAYAENPMDDKVAKKYEEAEEALTNYDSMMSEHLTKLDSYYSQIDLSVYDPVLDKQKIEDLRKEMNDFYDTQDKWAIANGVQDAKYNAITRIFGKNASEELKNIKREIQNVITAEDWDGTLNLSDYFNEADFDALIARLHKMGIYVYEVENYFKDMAIAEKEAADVSLYGVATDINKITEGLESLKSAFDEVAEGGSVTAKTLMELNEVFGTLGDSWSHYVNIMFSGVSSTKEMKDATEDLAKAFIDSKILTGEAISEYERMTYIIQLYGLGVVNAEEYVDAKIQENAYKSIQNSATYNDDELESNFNKLDKDKKNEFGIKGKDFEDLSTDELDKIAEYYNMTKEINAETAAKIADEYGIEKDNLNDVIGLLQKELDLKEQLADKKEEQTNQQIKYNEHQELIENIKLAIRDAENELKNMGYGNFLNEDGTINTIEWEIVYDDNGYKEYKNRETGIPLSSISNNFSQIEELQRLYQDLEQLKVSSPELVSDEDIAKLDEQIEQIQKELKIEVELDLELQKKSALVDDIQSVYDALMDAQKEYNDEGYFSVDTMQQLLELEPKYLDLLVDENGNINLNKQALYDVAVARLTDMKLKQQDAILTAAEGLAVEGTTDALYEQIDAMYSESEAYDVLIHKRLDSIRATLEERQAKGELAGFDINQYISGLKGQLDAVERVSYSAINNIRDSISSSGNGEAESALEELQKRYERQISNLDNQQTYLENEIERLEAENKTVSKSYYEDQIALEEKKLALYQQERAELLKLNRTDEVAEALWETEHAIQESTLRMVEFRQSIIDLYKTAFDDIVDAYDNKDDFLSDQQNYIDKYRELMELQGEIPDSYGYQEQIANEEEKMADNISELNSLRQALADGIASGYLEEGSEEWVEMQDRIRETEAAVLDNKIAIEEYRQELKQLSVDAFELVRNAFSNKGNFLTSQQEYIEGYADLLEAQGIDVPAEIYDELIKIEQEKRANNVADLVNARQGLANIEAAGYTAADEEWQDAYQQIVDLEKAVQDNDIAMAEYAKTIRDLDFEKFERFIDRLNDINSEIDNLLGLYDNDDVAFEDGTWTEEGITSLGLLYYQMEANKQISEEYTEKIDELNEQYDKGEMSEQEYYERLQDLKDGQWDAINAYESTKDSIVDLEEARIDMIEEGIEKEISAYEDLIEVKKEELDAERD